MELPPDDLRQLRRPGLRPTPMACAGLVLSWFGFCLAAWVVVLVAWVLLGKAWATLFP